MVSRPTIDVLKSVLAGNSGANPCRCWVSGRSAQNQSERTHTKSSVSFDVFASIGRRSRLGCVNWTSILDGTARSKNGRYPVLATAQC